MMAKSGAKEGKPPAFPVPVLVGFRADQKDLLNKAKMASGRAITDILREAGVAAARRIIADAKRSKEAA